MKSHRLIKILLVISIFVVAVAAVFILFSDQALTPTNEDLPIDNGSILNDQA